MTWIPVDSSNLSAVRYDVASLTLEVQFKEGRIYQYFDVPQQVFEYFIAADSKGKYFNANIKGVFRFARI